MSKVFVSVRFIDEDGDTHDWRGTFDIVIDGVANTKNLVNRMSELVLRELVRRGLIAPTEGEVPKPPKEIERKQTFVAHGTDGRFTSVPKDRAG